MDTASRDYITCSDMAEVSTQMAHNRYWKRVQASCRLSKGSLWMEAQQKRISESCQGMWGHDQECIRAEQKHTLYEDHNSFEMWKMAIRTDQLFCIAKATGFKIHTRESEAETDGRTRALALSLKQYHIHYYRLYKKGTVKAMVGLQGMYTSNAFWCFSVSSSIGLKSFCP